MSALRAYDVIVRVTVTAESAIKARRMVERFLPDPANEDNQHVLPGKHVDPSRGYRCRTDCADFIGPNYPVDSWALLTESRVIGTKVSNHTDRVTWIAVEVS